MSVPNTAITNDYRLTPMQQGMLFHTLFAPERAVYFEQSSWEIEGDFEIRAFRDAWRRVQTGAWHGAS